MILRILGFCSLSASVLRCFTNVSLVPFSDLGKIVGLFWCKRLSMFNSLSLIGSSLALLPFAGVMANVFCVVSKCSHFNLVVSIGLIAVSLKVCNRVATALLHEAISRSISFSVGMK